MHFVHNPGMQDYISLNPSIEMQRLSNVRLMSIEAHLDGGVLLICYKTNQL